MTDWINEPYDPIKFRQKTSAGVYSPWGVSAENCRTYRYRMVTPDTMNLKFCIQQSTVAIASINLMLAVPGGYQPADHAENLPISWFEDSYTRQGIGRVGNNQDLDPATGIYYLRFAKCPSHQYSPLSDNNWLPTTKPPPDTGTYIFGSLEFEVVTLAMGALRAK